MVKSGFLLHILATPQLFGWPISEITSMPEAYSLIFSLRVPAIGSFVRAHFSLNLDERIKMLRFRRNCCTTDTSRRSSGAFWGGSLQTMLWRAQIRCKSFHNTAADGVEEVQEKVKRYVNRRSPACWNSTSGCIVQERIRTWCSSTSTNGVAGACCVLVQKHEWW